MTLKKGHLVSFTRPMSTMRRVLSAVELGTDRRDDIMAETGLRMGQVRSALYNLVFIGAVVLQRDASGRTIYVTPGRLGPVAANLRGISSIFNCR